VYPANFAMPYFRVKTGAGKKISASALGYSFFIAIPLHRFPGAFLPQAKSEKYP
jgi:hypothetical protein